MLTLDDLMAKRREILSIRGKAEESIKILAADLQNMTANFQAINGAIQVLDELISEAQAKEAEDVGSSGS